MNRLMPFVFGVLVCVPAAAADPPKKLTAEERKELETKLKEANTIMLKAYQGGKPDEAVKACEEGLKVARLLYSKAEYPDGHAILALILNNLANLYSAQGRLGDAEPLYKDALEMYKRLLKG